MNPGTTEIVNKENFTICDNSLGDTVIDKLANAGIISKAVSVRPLATLKMIR